MSESDRKDETDAWREYNQQRREELLPDVTLDQFRKDHMTTSQREVRTESSTGGQKGTKPERYDLIPTEPLAILARLYGFGAQKYEAHNFRKGYEWSKSYAALQRHANQFWGGEDIDSETQLPHMASVAWHAFTLLIFMQEHPDFDDRYKAILTQEDLEKRFDDGIAAFKTYNAPVGAVPDPLTLLREGYSLAEPPKDGEVSSGDQKDGKSYGYPHDEEGTPNTRTPLYNEIEDLAIEMSTATHTRAPGTLSEVHYAYEVDMAKTLLKAARYLKRGRVAGD